MASAWTHIQSAEPDRQRLQPHHERRHRVLPQPPHPLNHPDPRAAAGLAAVHRAAEPPKVSCGAPQGLAAKFPNTTTAATRAYRSRSSRNRARFSTLPPCAHMRVRHAHMGRALAAAPEQEVRVLDQPGDAFVRPAGHGRRLGLMLARCLGVEPAQPAGRGGLTTRVVKDDRRCLCGNRRHLPFVSTGGEPASGERSRRRTARPRSRKMRTAGLPKVDGGASDCSAAAMQSCAGDSTASHA